MDRLQSFVGACLIVGLAWALSENRKKIELRTIAAGLLLQIALGMLILWSPPGQTLFEQANAGVLKIIQFSNAGAQMVFGEKYTEHFFAFSVLPSIVFLSSLMAILFHWGIMQRVVGAFAWVMRKTLRVSGAEATSAAAKVFVGGVEASFTIKPYVPGMTRSEIMTLSTIGLSTIAAGVLTAFVGMGIEAGHLLSAQIMSTIGAVVLSKILIPETSTPKTRDKAALQVDRNDVNVFDAACRGALDGVKVAAIVAGVLIAFVAITAMLNFGLGLLPDVGGQPLSFDRVLGWVFRPIVFLTGAPWDDSSYLGALLGKKIFLNEFLAFLDLTQLGGQISPRSKMLATYFLCGFGNFSAVAMQVGGLGALYPERKEQIAELGLRSLLAGCLASLLSACIAGVLMGE